MMKRLLVSLSTGLLAVLVGLPLSASADGYGHGQTFQAENVFNFDGSVANGAMLMTRGKNGVKVSISTTGLLYSGTYTVWWVIWNDPSQCNGACGDEDADFGVPGNAVVYAGGFLADAQGSANVNVHLKAGDLPDGYDAVIPGKLDKGNGFGAEIHVVLRTHSAPIPGRVAEQISTFFGACEVTHCEDVQFSVFFPKYPHHY